MIETFTQKPSAYSAALSKNLRYAGLSPERRRRLIYTYPRPSMSPYARQPAVGERTAGLTGGSTTYTGKSPSQITTTPTMLFLYLQTKIEYP